MTVVRQDVNVVYSEFIVTVLAFQYIYSYFVHLVLCVINEIFNLDKVISF